VMGEVIEKYNHLWSLNISKNEFTDIGRVARLPHLVKLIASENKLTNIDFFSKDADAFQFLQICDFKDNKIKLLP
jgi:Leucine-rich repeat (LRR) protein